MVWQEVCTQFEFCPQFGFIVPSPLETLGTYFDPWVDLVRDMEGIRVDTTRDMQQEIRHLPLLDHEVLHSKEELQLAHLLLSCLGMSYIHASPSRPAQTLPRQLAIPWYGVSSRLGIPPIIVHSTISLCNWRKQDTSGPMSLENLELLYSLDSSRDLEVFFLIPLLVEFSSVPAVKAVIDAQASLVKNNSDIFANLQTIKTSIQEMRTIIKQMSPGCNPEVFYHKHRPLLSGWDDNPLIPNGLLYEGASPKPQKFAGGSAAQSSVIQILDAGLGVQHSGQEGKFLVRMRDYMPPNQRGLIRHVEQGPSIRKTCLAGTQELRDSYNECLSELGMFRTDHLILVARYITTPSHINRGEAEHLAEQGTGGTALATFLKRTRQDTVDMVINVE